eukprot:TRINITY_DN40452_c0_g1_i1.p2 TRINITY_DN40452_c0_g1~~TRINITY_DN40452_c0_g1_i1.p2  ORF type:complete len:140 (-),score=10.16 TRINITY_DN40452_c0_g1_i1:145-564(-)
MEEVVQSEILKYPHRKYYLAGHSLGGAISKLISAHLHALLPNVSIQAIAFCSQGMRGWYDIGGVHHDDTATLGSITVQPANDIVSRIGDETGAVLPIPCAGDTLHCHEIWTNLCTMYKMCGSKRNLTLPCGVCPSMPCR